MVAVIVRQRRRLAAAALCRALAAGASPALAQPRGAGRALALVLRALEDEPAFQVRRPRPTADGNRVFSSGTVVGFEASFLFTRLVKCVLLIYSCSW